MKTYYDLLGLARDASADAVRRAYRDAAKHLHPDAAGGHTRAMVRLNEAYATLKDPAKRAAYDRSLSPSPGRPGPTGPVGPTDALDYRLRIFAPLDAAFFAAARSLDEAVDDLADDLYDDHYVLRFEQAVQATEFAFAEATARLLGVPWPERLRNGLNRYRQAVRQADDAIEEFKGFLSSYDEDCVVVGRELLRKALAMRVEALVHLDRG